MPTLPPVWRFLAAVLCAVLALFGCSSGGDPPASEQLTVLATQTVTSSGAEITVHSGDPTVDGFVVSIPSGALGTATETITIAKAPAARPLRPEAVAAGVIPVSATVRVSKTAPGALRSAAEVTLPFDTAAVGSTELPVVLAWDETAGRYDPVEAVTIDRVLGRVTVRTRTFARFTAFTVPGLLGALARGFAVDTGFRPGVDGFAVETFSTQSYEKELEGNCYALAAYADWYFKDRKQGAGADALFEHYRQHDVYPELAQRDDVARELIHDVFMKTLFSNRLSSNGGFWTYPDVWTLDWIITEMLITGHPQMISLSERKDAGDPGAGHTVLAYAWDPAFGLSVYDPDWPGQDRRIPWSPETATLGPYVVVDPTLVFTWVGFHTIRSLFDPLVFHAAHRRAEEGWPDKVFDSVSVVSPASQMQNASGDWAYEVNTTAPTVFRLRWAPQDPLWAGTIGYPRPSFAHVYLDGVFVTTAPVQSGYADVTLPPRNPAPSLLEVAVSTVRRGDDECQRRGGLAQDGVSAGYAGFLRTRVMPRVTCPDVHGTWRVTESGTVSCSGSFGSGEEPFSGSTSITLYQSGCRISFMGPLNAERSGTIKGNVVRLSGIAAVQIAPGVTLTRNRIDFTGTVSADARRMDLTGTGRVEGSYEGAPGACSVSSTEAMTR